MKLSFPGLLIVLAVGAGIGVVGARWYSGQGVPPSNAASQASKAASPAPTAPAPPAAPAGTAVEVVPVQRINMARSVSAVGTLRSENSVMLRPEISGRIVEINFAEGGKVKKGDTLFRLDDSVVKAQLQQAQASLSLAQSRHRRAQELSREGFISKQARDEAASELQVQQAAVALHQAQLEKTAILAPFDGLIGLRNVSVGDYVSPGQDLVSIESVNPLKVDFRVPEQFLAGVYPGLPLSVSFDAMPGQERQGEVGAISPVVDVGGRSLLLRASIPNDDDALRPGLFARVLLQLSDESVLAVPETALSPSGQSQFIFVVRDAKAVRLPVAVGMRRDTMVQVSGEVLEGDQVIVSGLQKVSDGAAVRVVNAQPGQPSPQSAPAASR